MSLRETTLTEISQRLEKLGDLPVFSASLNNIRRISADPDSSAMALSNEITKDASLSTKLLRLANSPYYNRGAGKIHVISRTVVILGFNTIKNLCLTLKLIDSFQHEHPSVDLNRLLISAYLSASFVRELAMQCGIRDVEESYLCALLHRLGEIAVAYCLPQQYIQMKECHEQAGLSGQQLELDTLGISFSEIGQEFATCWEFPDTLVKTMEAYDPTDEGRLRSGIPFNRALASLGNQVVDYLHSPDQREEGKLQTLLACIGNSTGLDHTVVENGLMHSYRMSCELAQDYGLDRQLLIPPTKPCGDEFSDRLVNRLGYLANNYHGAEDADPQAAADCEQASPVTVAGAAVAGTTNTAVQDTTEDTQRAARQLAFIQEITALISERSPLNAVFIKILQGLHEGVGFDRATLVLLNPALSHYSARLAVGDDQESLKSYFERPVQRQQDLFSDVLLGGNELLVENVNDPAWRHLLGQAFATATGAGSFIVAPLRQGTKPIGLFYADNATRSAPISPEDHRGFIHFVSQGRLALQLSSVPRND
ncbi:MAG: HDOD domain-containing protein [Gammaproteobacteria bacterium]